MKKCYIINYDLHGKKDYESLYEAIKSLGAWAKILESCWAVVTTKTAVEIREILLNKMDSDDSIFIIKSGGEAAWKKVICSDKWLKDNI